MDKQYIQIIKKFFSISLVLNTHMMSGMIYLGALEPKLLVGNESVKVEQRGKQLGRTWKLRLVFEKIVACVWLQHPQKCVMRKIIKVDVFCAVVEKIPCESNSNLELNCEWRNVHVKFHRLLMEIAEVIFN